MNGALRTPLIINTIMNYQIYIIDANSNSSRHRLKILMQTPKWNNAAAAADDDSIVALFLVWPGAIKPNFTLISRFNTNPSQLGNCINKSFLKSCFI